MSKVKKELVLEQALRLQKEADGIQLEIIKLAAALAAKGGYIGTAASTLSSIALTIDGCIFSAVEIIDTNATPRVSGMAIVDNCVAINKKLTATLLTLKKAVEIESLGTPFLQFYRVLLEEKIEECKDNENDNRVEKLRKQLEDLTQFIGKRG